MTSRTTLGVVLGNRVFKVFFFFKKKKPSILSFSKSAFELYIFRVKKVKEALLQIFY